MLDQAPTTETNTRRLPLIKARVISADTPAPARQSESALAFQGVGALEPPYDPEALCTIHEHSNALRQNVDAYAVNIDGFGYRFDALLEFDDPGARQVVHDHLWYERLEAKLSGDLTPDKALEPSAEEVDAKLAELAVRARLERIRAKAFFETCCDEHSFVELRRRTRQDREITGNAYWEVLRDGRRRISQLIHVPSVSMRLMPRDVEATALVTYTRVPPLRLEARRSKRRLRRYVQISDMGTQVFFKELGDPRPISRATGQPLASGDNAGDEHATEMIHFAIASPRSPYGVPRWIGTLLSVLGSRQAEEVNFLYFENKSVPPMAVLVSGGKIADASVARITDFVEHSIKGKNNFHKILILEADGPSNSELKTPAKIELKPLTDAQLDDALFQHYDERNIDKVGQSFRLPRLLRGDSRDFNRATAESALRFAEDQVFQPERDAFDYLINRRLMAALGISLWSFRSQTPVIRDPERMSKMVEELSKVGVLTPAEARELAGDIFNRRFRRIAEGWVKRPLALTLAGVGDDAHSEGGAGHES